jgi:hypothetical protein
LADEVQLVFNTPNSSSLPGYLRMGWHMVGEIPVRVRVRRPVRLIAGAFANAHARATVREHPSVDAPAARDLLIDQRSVSTLLEASEVPNDRYSTPLSVEYLRWRYGEAPLLGYHAVKVEAGGELIGLAFFRLRAHGSLWGISVAEVIVRQADVATARRLLRAVRRAADAGYLAMSFPRRTAAARAQRPTTLRAPRGKSFVVNPLGEDLEPDPRLRSSWALSMGDVEVF